MVALWGIGAVFSTWYLFEYGEAKRDDDQGANVGNRAVSALRRMYLDARLFSMRVWGAIAILLFAINPANILGSLQAMAQLDPGVWAGVAGLAASLLQVFGITNFRPSVVLTAVVAVLAIVFMVRELMD